MQFVSKVLQNIDFEAHIGRNRQCRKRGKFGFERNRFRRPGTAAFFAAICEMRACALHAQNHAGTETDNSLGFLNRELVPFAQNQSNGRIPICSFRASARTRWRARSLRLGRAAALSFSLTLHFPDCLHEIITFVARRHRRCTRPRLRKLQRRLIVCHRLLLKQRMLGIFAVNP